jgi:hypothetical protein
MYFLWQIIVLKNLCVYDIYINNISNDKDAKVL